MLQSERPHFPWTLATYHRLLNFWTIVKWIGIGMISVYVITDNFYVSIKFFISGLIASFLVLITLEVTILKIGHFISAYFYATNQDAKIACDPLISLSIWPLCHLIILKIFVLKWLFFKLLWPSFLNVVDQEGFKNLHLLLLLLFF